MSDRRTKVLPLHSARPARAREPLWRDVIGEVLRDERQHQSRTLREVSDDATVSMAYLSEVERGRKEVSSEILAAAARALGLTLAELISRAHDRLAAEEVARRQAMVLRTVTTRHTGSLARGAGGSGAVSLAA